MKIDTTKPLVINTPALSKKNEPVKLIAVDTNTGHIIVDTSGLRKDSHWMKFSSTGQFLASATGGGTSITLANEEEKITHRFTASFMDGAVFFGPVIGPACDVQIVTQGDKITSIVARAE